jgi:hypothetical protein
MYTLHPYRSTGDGSAERCDHYSSDFFRICRIEKDGTETAVIDYEFEDSAEMVSQWANATKQLGRLERGEI